MALGSMSYVPTLKAREAEIKALLKSPNALKITPLFELQRASAGTTDQSTGQRKRAKGSTTDASYFLDDIARLWDEPLYVDISRVDGGRRETWWKLLDSLNSLVSSPAALIPVLVPGDASTVRSAAAGLAAHTGRAALRVPMVSYRHSAAGLAGATQAVAADVGIPASSVDVILDWADAMASVNLDGLVSATSNAITALGGHHGELITIGTPNSDAFLQEGDWTTDRREWWLWLRLAHAGLDVTYGDYALYTPADPAPAVPRYGHLRYSSGHQMHVHRRAIPKSGGGLGAAFKTCCDHLLGEPHWLGSAFSKADQRIHDIATNADKESTPGGWRQLAFQHHMAVVAEQLASPPAAPPAGTP